MGAGIVESCGEEHLVFYETTVFLCYVNEVLLKCGETNTYFLRFGVLGDGRKIEFRMNITEMKMLK